MCLNVTLLELDQAAASSNFAIEVDLDRASDAELRPAAESFEVVAGVLFGPGGDKAFFGNDLAGRASEPLFRETEDGSGGVHELLGRGFFFLRLGDFEGNRSADFKADAVVVLGGDELFVLEVVHVGLFGFEFINEFATASFALDNLAGGVLLRTAGDFGEFDQGFDEVLAELVIPLLVERVANDGVDEVSFGRDLEETFERCWDNDRDGDAEGFVSDDGCRVVRHGMFACLFVFEKAFCFR